MGKGIPGSTALKCLITLDHLSSPKKKKAFSLKYLLIKRRILPPSGLPGRKQPKVERSKKSLGVALKGDVSSRATLCTQKQVKIQVLDHSLTGRKVGIMVIFPEQLQSCYRLFVGCRWVQRCRVNGNTHVSPSAAHGGRDHGPRSKSVPIAENQKKIVLFALPL